MMENKIISIDISADFGFLKKPDINDGIYLTYNMLHKPAFLGILGAIIGLDGYSEKGKFPEYYLSLKNLKIGIEPLNSENGNYTKTVIQYNNAVGYASQEAGGNLIIREQVLIKPKFRCYILIPQDHPNRYSIIKYLEKKQAKFLPYFGKNDFSLWWDNFQMYHFKLFPFNRDYKICTIFMKSDQILKNFVQRSGFGRFGGSQEGDFMCFEELPVDFDERLVQYNKHRFVFTNFIFSSELKIDNLYQLEDKDELVQLF